MEEIKSDLSSVMFESHLCREFSKDWVNVHHVPYRDHLEKFVGPNFEQKQTFEI